MPPKLSDKLRVYIHKDNIVFVKQMVKKTGATNPSEWINQVLRRLQAGNE